MTYLEVEEVFVLIRLEAEDVSVVLAVYLLEDCVEGEDDEVDQLQLALQVHPIQVRLALLVLIRIGGTVVIASSPFSLQAFTFLVEGSWINLPARTAYRYPIGNI
jgi:hypothetical protein